MGALLQGLTLLSLWWEGSGYWAGPQGYEIRGEYGMLRDGDAGVSTVYRSQVLEEPQLLLRKMGLRWENVLRWKVSM